MAPYGVLKDDLNNRKQPPATTPKDWPADDTSYPGIIQGWMAEAADKIWPRWENGAWAGSAAVFADDVTRMELELAVHLYHGGGNQPGVLSDLSGAVIPFEGPRRNNRWHYDTEDARLDHPDYNSVTLPDDFTSGIEYRTARNGVANYPLYGGPVVDPGTFFTKFLVELGNGNKLPEVLGLKDLFQRPRPNAAAVALGVHGFRWVTAHRNIHTGQHPAFPSGHCMQGILGGCNVYAHLLATGVVPTTAEREALQQYMVDWGDRRVFAGVHYMTDNIASWTLMRRMIPHLFKAPQILDLAVGAITSRSRVFADVIAHFDEANPARRMLVDDFPEAAAVA